MKAGGNDDRIFAPRQSGTLVVTRLYKPRSCPLACVTCLFRAVAPPLGCFVDLLLAWRIFIVLIVLVVIP